MHFGTGGRSFGDQTLKAGALRFCRLGLFDLHKRAIHIVHKSLAIRHARQLDLVVGAVLGIDVLLVVVAESLLLVTVEEVVVILGIDVLLVVVAASLLLCMGCEVMVPVPKELIVALLELGGFVKAQILSK